MDKRTKEQLEKFGLKIGDITHVCIAPNFYPLLQYVLLLPEDVVSHHSYFFLVDLIPASVRNRIPCSSFEHVKGSIHNEIVKRIHKLSFRFFKHVKYPFLRTADIYAWDLPYLNLLIGDKDYNLLADSPNWLTLNSQKHSAEYKRQMKHAASLLGRMQKLIYGDIFVNYFGRNNQCKTIYLTEENISPVLEGKRVVINSLQELWNSSSDNKREYIKHLFGITDEDIALFNSRSIIFFSQPLVKDCGLPEDDFVEILRKIFSNYDANKLIIKTHPRDGFDYAKYFPDILVSNKSVNFQLLQLCGVLPKQAVTICSTAITELPETVSCDYFYEPTIHPILQKYFGNDFRPSRSVQYKSISDKSIAH